MKAATNKIILIIFILIACIAFVVKFAGPMLLRTYVAAGMGGCQNQPIFCISPGQEIISEHIDKDYLAGLERYKFPKMEIYAPKEFMVIKEQISKIYYKKSRREEKGSVIYLLYEKPNFFVDLFPQLYKQGIKNDYEFIEHTMYAKVSDIKNLTDAFFVIMKSVFTPDLGDQSNLKMIQFKIADKRGFISYNLAKSGNYFDCNITDRLGDFFKVYIKDKDASLGLDKALAIISTIKATN